MTINLDTEIVATRHDKAARVSHYTIERNGRRWTAAVPEADLDKHGRGVGSKDRRRNHIANVLILAMRGKADGER